MVPGLEGVELGAFGKVSHPATTAPREIANTAPREIANTAPREIASTVMLLLVTTVGHSYRI